ncbi:hypothetical protein AB835_02610 [Candidatus Endobugula sertula]|uniref:Uncharacterized protein n=1 Tax=Candidatus Endobugula sertula TaxID=62101 RepID=A0A1D2QST7_9GAMM|nr:hypothetical protein AB835_02610 [Candidatus Endobugula sertula]
MKTLPILVPCLFILASNALFSQSVIAQNEGRWYQVEFLIFKRLTGTEQSGEIWRQDISLNYPEKYRYLSNTLPTKAHTLGGHNYALRKSGQYKVLFHKAWNQQMWGKKKSPAIIIRGGERYGIHRELEGSIKIHIGRYLHVSTDLWLNSFTIDTQDTSTNNDNPAVPFQLPLLPSKSPNQNTAGINEFFTENPQPHHTVVFREKRRMRSKETHYIDHPLMGVLVRMLPIDPPAPP